MSPRRWWIFLVAVSLAPFSRAQETVMRAPGSAAATVLASVQFVSPTAIDFKALLPEPPPLGSIAAQADLEAVLQVQAWRTPEQVAWAKLVEKDHVFNHASVLGAWFAGERLPQTTAFFKRIGDDLRALDGAAKKPFLRLRPPAVDARVQPCVTLPASTSYPSGSGMQAFVWAELLAEIIPAQRSELIARAERAAWGRVIGGVHFPSDVVAGRRLALLFIAECRKSPEFQSAFEACRREIVTARPPDTR
ncbi:MAG: phosphatase PAP2 family protein [Opitutus sp.]|nr:phosphatase PAP2 family protein [Opitutus sp.]